MNIKTKLLLVAAILQACTTIIAGIYQTPTSSFITNPNESVKELSFYSGGRYELQNMIATARTNYPDAVLVIHIRGLVTVGNAPILLGSKTCLSFEGCGKLMAKDVENCQALIHIQDAEYVSISAMENKSLAVIDGQNIARNAIVITNSGKVNIDNINISNCVDYGIDYSGRGEDSLNDAGSVTRCNISNSGISGIKITNAARFVLMDNVITGNTVCGIDATSQSATICGNSCSDNKTGIKIGAPADVDGPDATVTRNILTSNNVGLELCASTQKHLVTENIIQQNDTGMIADGYRNHIFNNDMDNVDEFDVRGTENIIARHKKIIASEVTGGTSTKFFNPPTADNPHQDSTIVFGMGRRDITFTQQSGESAVDLATVQSSVNTARSSYPDDYLVIWLNGTFVAKGEYTGLSMPSNSSVVLNGTIYPEGDGMDRNSAEDHYLKDRHSGGTQLVLMDSSGYLSFSGGTLDCKRLPAYGIYAPYNNVGLIDGVTIKEAVDNNIGTLYHGGDSTPMFIRGCNFYGGEYFTNRAVWIHVCNYIHCISNHSEGHVADSFDFDAGGHWSTALFNTCHNEKRTGVFIEEQASNNSIICNEMTGPVGNGIALYSSIGGQCENNIIVANTVTGPYGMNIRHATNTFAFNNIMNTGQFGVYINVNDNYSAQNASAEIYNMSDLTSNPFFTSPYYNYEKCDYTGDGVVDMLDWVIMAEYWINFLDADDLAYMTEYWLSEYAA